MPIYSVQITHKQTIYCGNSNKKTNKIIPVQAVRITLIMIIPKIINQTTRLVTSFC